MRPLVITLTLGKYQKHGSAQHCIALMNSGFLVWIDAYMEALRNFCNKWIIVTITPELSPRGDAFRSSSTPCKACDVQIIWTCAISKHRKQTHIAIDIRMRRSEPETGAATVSGCQPLCAVHGQFASPFWTISKNMFMTSSFGASKRTSGSYRLRHFDKAQLACKFQTWSDQI